MPGYGYNITGIDVLDAYAAVMLVAGAMVWMKPSSRKMYEQLPRRAVAAACSYNAF